MPFETLQDASLAFFKRNINRTYFNDSATGAAAVVAATAPAVAAKTFYLQGFSITGLGATLGVGVAPTITGLVTETMTFSYAAIAGALLSNSPLTISFGDIGIPASAVNTAVAVSCPSLGTGNTANTVNLWGYYV